MYSWLKSVTFFWSTLVFFPWFDVAVRWEFVKSAREFLIGPCTHQAQSWYCFLHVSSKVRNCCKTVESYYLREFIAHGLPIRLMVSERLVTCLWKVCVERRAHGAGNFLAFKVKILNGTHRIIHALLLTYWLSIEVRYNKGTSSLWLTLALTLTTTMTCITWSTPRMSKRMSLSNSSTIETREEWYCNVWHSSFIFL